MPELPEVETARRGIETAIKNKTLTNITVNRRDLRIPVPNGTEALLKGKRCDSLTRRGKYIIFSFSKDAFAVLHLGMSGRVRVYKPDQTFAPQKHDHVILGFDDGTTIVFHDPRRFGFFYAIQGAHWQNEKPFCEMGPEPLGDWDENDFLTVLSARHAPIKTTLLDQAVVSGLGNIYVCEALFCAGISPIRPAKSLRKPETSKLMACTKTVLEKALKAGGSTLRDYQQTDGSLGYFQYQFSVYDREDQPCPRSKCTGKILRMIQSGRSTFYCPTCQK